MGLAAGSASSAVRPATLTLAGSAEKSVGFALSVEVTLGFSILIHEKIEASICRCGGRRRVPSARCRPSSAAPSRAADSALFKNVDSSHRETNRVDV